MSAKKEDKKEEKPKEDPKKDPKKGAQGDAPAEGAEGAEGEGTVKPRSKKKLIIIIVVGLLVLGGGAAGLILSGVLGGGDAKKKTEKTDKSDKDSKEEVKDGEAANGEEVEIGEDGKPIPKGPVFVDLPDIVANLSSPTPRAHFINLKLTLELASRKDLKSIEDQMPRIKDAFNSYLREIRKEDLEGSAGMNRLENELMLRLEKIFGKDKVKTSYSGR